MKNEDLRVGWEKLDQTADPRSFIRFLDANDADEWTRAHKGRALALLEAQPGSRFLDVGCGTGTDVRTLAQQVGPEGKVVGIDLSTVMITEAQKRAEGSHVPMEFKQASVYDLPFADDTFDGCYSFLTFDILEHPQPALAEVIRVVKPGGRIVNSGCDYDTIIVDAPNRALTRTLQHFYCDSLYNGWIGRQLRGLYKEAGLQEIAVLPDTAVVTDYAFVKQRTLQPLVDRALAVGIISAADATAWLRSLYEASQAGRFFSAGTTFIVSGRKS